MKTTIKLTIATLIAISFSSCQTMQSGNDNARPPINKKGLPPMVVC